MVAVVVVVVVVLVVVVVVVVAILAAVVATVIHIKVLWALVFWSIKSRSLSVKVAT